ncbi:MAG: DUF4097 family beta strand repeat protein [Anaerolineae bacterium]|nr:DUF4097 family beta strand repeat protein [Anaerolineae bacterium]
MMEERIEQSFETGPQAEVSVENVNGPVTVEGWDEARVYLDARRRGERARVVFHHEGARVEVRTEIEPRDGGLMSWWGRGETAEVEYTLRVPRDTRLRLRNVHGPLRAANFRGALEAKSVDGAVQVFQVLGELRAEATNGSVELTGVQGQAQAYTTNGSITLRDGQLDSVIAETVNGSIHVDPLSAGCAVRARTVNGELNLNVPNGVAAELEASGVMLRTSMNISHQSYTSGRTAWRGRVGSGEPNAQVSFSTVNGHVRVNGRQGTAPALTAGETAAPTPLSAEGGEGGTAAWGAATPTAAPAASDQPRDVMGILQAIERGDVSVEQGLDMMKKLS